VSGSKSVLLMENGMSHLLHGKQAQTTIRQVKLLHIDALTAACHPTVNGILITTDQRGTKRPMNARDLTVKFASYAHYLASREWAREGAKPPWLLCVAPQLEQERRMQRVAQGSLTSTAGLAIWTTTAALSREHGPLAPIWSPGPPLPGQTAKALNRRGVFETICEKKR
jgi:hypothetical protein